MNVQATIIYYKSGKISKQILSDTSELIDNRIQEFIKEVKPEEYMSFIKDSTMDDIVYQNQCDEYTKQLQDKYINHLVKHFSYIKSQLSEAPEYIKDDFNDIVLFAFAGIPLLGALKETGNRYADLFGRQEIKWLKDNIKWKKSSFTVVFLIENKEGIQEVKTKEVQARTSKSAESRVKKDLKDTKIIKLRAFKSKNQSKIDSYQEDLEKEAYTHNKSKEDKKDGKDSNK
jgi:hypothetical protein